MNKEQLPNKDTLSLNEARISLNRNQLISDRDQLLSDREQLLSDKEYLISQLDKLLLDDSIILIIEEKLKHISQSDYIYNRELPENLEQLSKEEMLKLIKELYADNYKVCKDNEQFRAKNFKQYAKLRKFRIED